jgi:hypothetical protein
LLAAKLSIITCEPRKHPTLSHRWEAVNEKKQHQTIESKMYLTAVAWMIGRKRTKLLPQLVTKNDMMIMHTNPCFYIFSQTKVFQIWLEKIHRAICSKARLWMVSWCFLKIRGNDVTRQSILEKLPYSKTTISYNIAIIK